MGPGFTLQGRVVGEIVCELGAPIDNTWALPGPLAAVFGLSTELQRVFEASVDFSTGPRLEGKLALGATGSLMLGFDTSLEGDDRDLSSAEFSLDAERSGVGEWSLPDDRRAQLTGKLVFVGTAGVQLGGIAPSKAAEWSAWIPMVAGYVQEAADALNLDLLESEVGPVLGAECESSKRVLNQEGSNGTVALDAVGTLDLRSEALNEILATFGHGALKLNLLDIRFPLGTLFRVFDGDEIRARTESFDGLVQDGFVTARIGETAEFRTQVQYKGAPLTFVSDRPLTRGEVRLGESAYLGPYTDLDAAAHELTFRVPIAEEICDAGLSFLAFNDANGSDSPVYGGHVDVACAAGATHTLQVEPPDAGRVVSEPAGIDCGGDVIPLGVRVAPMGSLEGITLVVAPSVSGEGLRTGALSPAFADATSSHVADGGALVSAWLADDAAMTPAPALVLVRDVDSRLYLEPRDGSAPTVEPDGLGLDARELRCTEMGPDA